MKLSSRKFLFTATSVAGVAAIVIACGSSEDSKFKVDPNPPSFSDSGFDPDADPQNNDDLYANDPPPAWCGPGTDDPNPPIEGTAECPSDKNKPGCACTQLGEKQPCWTGLRKHRNLGICKDGVAECVRKNETTNVWGPCEGQVLPERDAKGKEACACFSFGEWKIDNTSPCNWSLDGTNYFAYSTVYDKGSQTTSFCSQDSHASGPGQVPSGIWSTNTLKVDCAGTFKLCYRIRAGTYETPNASDCILGEVCIDAVYEKENEVQQLPDLPAWAGTDQACSKKWESETPANVSPGYGEMVVKGQTVRCDEVGNAGGQTEYVFHRVKYCPRICRDEANKNDPACVDCQLKGQGSFE